MLLILLIGCTSDGSIEPLLETVPVVTEASAVDNEVISAESTLTKIAPTPTETAPNPTVAPTAIALPEPVTLTSDEVGEVNEVEEVAEVVVPIAEQVVIAGVDGVEIMGDFQSDGIEPQPAVLLLHMLNNRRQSWEPFVPELLTAGYAVLAIDMRGHGATGGEQEWTLAEQDLQLVFDWLQARPEVNAEQVAVVGASIGGNMAIRTAANDTEVAGVIMLSAGLNYRGVTTEDALQAYGDNPVLIVAAEGDSGAKDSAETLESQQPERYNTELIIYGGSAHGTSLFAAQPDIIPTLVDWLNKNLR